MGRVGGEGIATFGVERTVVESRLRRHGTEGTAPHDGRSDVDATSWRGISHLDLSVSDAEASAAWYERVLGLRRVRRTDFAHRVMVVLVHPPTHLVIGLNQHEASSGEPFDERRAGLDHVGFTVEVRADLDGLEEHLTELDVPHSAVADTDSGSALVFRDPDNIQLEFWWAKPRGS